MSMDEIKREVNLRYRERITGVEVEPRLVSTSIALHLCLWPGESRRSIRNHPADHGNPSPGHGRRIAAGRDNRQVVIFRRARIGDWSRPCLTSACAHLGKRPNPADEIWLRDNDLIIVPPRPIKVFGDFVRQVFTEGIYPMVPNFLSVSSTAT